MNIKVYTNLLLAGILAAALSANSVRRGRNEGTFGIRASNVIGSGNITTSAILGGELTDNYLQSDAAIGVKMGIAEIMQVGANAGFINFSKLGPAHAYLQLTLPDNDRLRFFGFSVSGNLYLSTARDTISISADSSKPLYSTYVFPSAVMDFDFLSLNKKLPLKAYMSFGFVRDIQLLYRYKQLCFMGGIELKMMEHSIFIEGGSALFREKQNKFNRTGDPSYEQMLAWIKPGLRYRLKKFFSLTGGVGINLFRNDRSDGGIDPVLFDLSLRFTAPLVFRETNTEAIRTLVFVENRKKEETLVSEDAETEEEIAEKLGLSDEKIDKEFFDYKKEKEELKKDRENIEEKMEKIEKLLEEDE